MPPKPLLPMPNPGMGTSIRDGRTQMIVIDRTLWARSRFLAQQLSTRGRVTTRSIVECAIDHYLKEAGVPETLPPEGPGAAPAGGG